VNQQRQLISALELQEALGPPPPPYTWIERAAKAGQIPSYSVNGRLGFVLAEVLESLRPVGVSKTDPTQRRRQVPDGVDPDSLEFVKDAAESLNVPVDWLRLCVHVGAVPSYAFRGGVKVDVREVFESLASVPTPTSICASDSPAGGWDKSRSQVVVDRFTKLVCACQSAQPGCIAAMVEHLAELGVIVRFRSMLPEWRIKHLAGVALYPSGTSWISRRDSTGRVVRVARVESDGGVCDVNPNAPRVDIRRVVFGDRDGAAQ